MLDSALSRLDKTTIHTTVNKAIVVDGGCARSSCKPMCRAQEGFEWHNTVFLNFEISKIVLGVILKEPSPCYTAGAIDREVAFCHPALFL